MALGVVDVLCYPTEICELGWAVDRMFAAPPESLAETATRRDASSILDAVDLYFRCNSLCAWERVEPVKWEGASGGLDHKLVEERLYALNWLICYANKEWDELVVDY